MSKEGRSIYFVQEMRFKSHDGRGLRSTVEESQYCAL